uniref:Uncharacterized protein n=1 Tax=Oryza brachyantha TaxID=4533 RepID=J3LC80_ORYBR
MADANMEWAELPRKCLATILSHLPCILDHIMFSGVCKRWRTVAGRNLPLMQPWLLMPSTSATSFFCVACGHTHQGPRMPDCARGARLCGSFLGGWLAAADIPGTSGPPLPWNRAPAMLNLCTGERVDLPRSLLGNNPGVTNINFFHVITFSAYYAAATVSGKPNIVFWRGDMSSWTPPMLKWDAPMKKWKKLLPKDPIEDVKYFVISPLGNGFHVLTNREDLLVYTPNTNDKRRELTMSSVERYRVRKNPSPTMPEPGEVLARFLVVSRGKMLMVVKFVSSENATVAFDVFRLDRQQPPSWSLKKVPLDTLTDRSIFLKRGCSVSLDDSPRYLLPG